MPHPARASASTPAADGCTGAGVLHDLLGRAVLDGAPGVHRDDLVGHGPRDGEVVGDQQVADARLLLQLQERLEHRLLGQHVQRRVGSSSTITAGSQQHRQRDRDALTGAAAQFVRVRDPDAVGVEVDGGEQLQARVFGVRRG